MSSNERRKAPPSKEELVGLNTAHNPDEVRKALNGGRWVDMNAVLVETDEPPKETKPQQDEVIDSDFKRALIIVSFPEPAKIEFRDMDITGIKLDVAKSLAEGDSLDTIKRRGTWEQRSKVDEERSALEALGKETYPDSVAPLYSAILSLTHMGLLPTDKPTKKLTPEEHVLLRKLSAGEGIHQKTEGFDLSDKLVRRAVDRLMNRLNATTKPQLLVIAASLHEATLTTPQS